MAPLFLITISLTLKHSFRLPAPASTKLTLVALLIILELVCTACSTGQFMDNYNGYTWTYFGKKRVNEDILG